MTDEDLQVRRFETSAGVRIYRITCEAFPGFLVHCYLLLGAGPPTLVDTGSGYGESNSHLFRGLEDVSKKFDESFSVPDISRVLITHGHIDHMGGVSHVVERTGAAVGVHELDRRILTNYSERVVIATKALRFFLQQAGVPQKQQREFMEMYEFSKKHVVDVPVEFLLNDGDEMDGLHFYHTPGHCSGQVCIGIDNVLLSADHVLPSITPHQSPESITACTGLGHYLESLKSIRNQGPFQLILGGHESPFSDLPARVDEIIASHDRMLGRVLNALRESDSPMTTHELSNKLYRRVRGFHVLLALEEVGAHVEYLYQRGMLAVTNLDEVQQFDNPAIYYRPVES